jgi:hypothetical protein
MTADCPASPIDRRAAAASRTTSYPCTKARPESGSSRVVSAHGGRLARAVRAENAQHGPMRHRQVDATQRAHVSDDLVKPSTKIAGPEPVSPELVCDTHPPYRLQPHLRHNGAARRVHDVTRALRPVLWMWATPA